MTVSHSQGKLPGNFHDMFTLVNRKHQYRTRLASKSSYYLPKSRTNYDKFSIRFQGPKIWNSIDESVKTLNKHSFVNSRTTSSIFMVIPSK